jgi:predicted nuclease with TOPRIM domain
MTNEPKLRETDMAKRGRPVTDIQKLKNQLEEAWDTNDALRVSIKKLTAEMIEQSGQIESLEYQNRHLREENEINKGLAERVQELLAEVRMYEHEHSTLRHIIIDALRQEV